jgi:hypothetical protein
MQFLRRNRLQGARRKVTLTPSAKIFGIFLMKHVKQSRNFEQPPPVVSRKPLGPRGATG